MPIAANRPDATASLSAEFGWPLAIFCGVGTVNQWKWLGGSAETEDYGSARPWVLSVSVMLSAGAGVASHNYLAVVGCDHPYQTTNGWS